jgi:hypothetical protein
MRTSSFFKRKRTLIPLVIAVAVVAALGIMAYLRAKAPPEAARLLPESDAIVYVNLKPLRATTHLDKTPVNRSPAFQQFIDATGIVPERDVDSAAFALHRVPVQVPGSPQAADIFTSEVFTGRFDGQRLTKYLSDAATSQEKYANHVVYTIQLDDQKLRVAQLDYDMIAASNMPTAEQIHSMLDRSNAPGISTPGCSLLAARFHDVPLLSQAWGIGHIGLPFSRDGVITMNGFQLPLAADSDLVASVRYTPAEHMLSGGAVKLRVDDIAPSELAAKTTVDSLNAVLDLLRSFGNGEQPHDPGDAALRQVITATSVEQHTQRAQLEATATLDQVKAIFSAHDPAAQQSDTAPAPAPPCPATPKGRKPIPC